MTDDEQGTTPVALDYARRGVDDARRDGKYLVVNARADLSGRCVRCGRPSVGPPVVRGMLNGKSAAFFSDMGSSAVIDDGFAAVAFFAFLAVVGLAVLGVVLLLGHRRRVAFGLCGAHRGRRRAFRRAAAVVGVAAVAMLAATAAQFDTRPRDDMTLWWGVLLTATLAIVAIFLARGGVGVSLHKCDGRELWLDGVGTGFLDAAVRR